MGECLFLLLDHNLIPPCIIVQVKVPLVAMKGGVDLQKYVDVLLPAAPATIKIIQANIFCNVVTCILYTCFNGWLCLKSFSFMNE